MGASCVSPRHEPEDELDIRYLVDDYAEGSVEPYGLQRWAGPPISQLTHVQWVEALQITYSRLVGEFTAVDTGAQVTTLSPYYGRLVLDYRQLNNVTTPHYQEPDILLGVNALDRLGTANWRLFDTDYQTGYTQFLRRHNDSDSSTTASTCDYGDMPELE